MSRRAYEFRHEFVRSFPERLEEGVLYVSVEFDSTAHRCMCGCGQEVYAQLSPRDWSMIYDGETVSLDPSIGNWSFACRSHYWLDRGRVSWAAQWSKDQIERGRAFDRVRKAQHYGEQPEEGTPARERRGVISRFFGWIIGR
jgi:uncharacterized protein DUF6527